MTISNIEKINNLVLDAGYTDINVGELTKKLKFEGGYGSLTVDNDSCRFRNRLNQIHGT